MTKLSTEELAQIAERCEKATEGEWEVGKLQYGTCAIEGEDFLVKSESCEEIARTDDWENKNADNDAAFIANARQDIPKLLAEIERLNKELSGDGALTLPEQLAHAKDEVERLDKLTDELYSISLWSTRRLPQVLKPMVYDWIDKATGEESERV